MFQGSLTMPVGAPVAKPHPVSMPRYVRARGRRLTRSGRCGTGCWPPRSAAKRRRSPCQPGEEECDHPRLQDVVAVHVAELAIPTNTLAEMRRDLDRLRFVKRQIKEIEKTRAERLAKAPDERPCGSACAYASGRRRGRDRGHARPGGVLARDAGP